MPNPRQLLRDDRPIPTPGSMGASGNVSGYVSYDVPPPTSTSDPLYVIVPNHSFELAIPISQWSPNGTDMPAQGTSVLVGYDENGVPHVIWWGVAPAIPAVSPGLFPSSGLFPTSTLFPQVA